MNYEKQDDLNPARGFMVAIAISILFWSAVAWSATAFFSHETTSGGLTKQCHYRYLNEMYTITVSSVSLCPLSIQV